MEAACQEALASEEPAAIIVRRPCLLIKRYKFQKSLCKVDPALCRSCKSCLRVGCPAISFNSFVISSLLLILSGRSILPLPDYLL